MDSDAIAITDANEISDSNNLCSSDANYDANINVDILNDVDDHVFVFVVTHGIFERDFVKYRVRNAFGVSDIHGNGYAYEHCNCISFEINRRDVIKDRNCNSDLLVGASTSHSFIWPCAIHCCNRSFAHSTCQTCTVCTFTVCISERRT